jgi:DNA modification methylase
MTVRILQGDCRDVLKTLPDRSVHCVVTSPPYWGLRDYGVAGQLGLEPLHDCLGWATGNRCGACHVCHMVEVFRLVRGMLVDDGTLWLNYGDCYATGAGKVGDCPGGGKQGVRWRGDVDRIRDDKRGYRGDNTSAPGKHGYRLDSSDGEVRRPMGPTTQPNRLPLPGLKPKDLVGMPWRVALALQADGWWLRQDIIWHKPNPMPESVTDRCTKAHEYLFLLAKSERYYFDQNAIKEPASENTNPRRAGNGYKTPDGWETSKSDGGHGSFHRGGREKGRTGYQPRRHLPGNRTHKGKTAYENGAEEHRTKAGLVKYAEKMRKLAEAGNGIKNNDSMDEALAVTPDTRNKRSVWTVATQPYRDAHFATFPPSLIEPCILAGCPEGGTVLDPFGGAGTTGLVADRLRRDALLIELNPEYVEMARKRIVDDAPLFARVTG